MLVDAFLKAEQGFCVRLGSDPCSGNVTPSRDSKSLHQTFVHRMAGRPNQHQRRRPGEQLMEDEDKPPGFQGGFVDFIGAVNLKDWSGAV